MGFSPSYVNRPLYHIHHFHTKLYNWGDSWQQEKSRLVTVTGITLSYIHVAWAFSYSKSLFCMGEVQWWKVSYIHSSTELKYIFEVFVLHLRITLLLYYFILVFHYIYLMVRVAICFTLHIKNSNCIQITWSVYKLWCIVIH